jgi:3,4-dihydroxy 2-butanone 4-phosphate synthase / GTP cyclohydrolase II
VHRGAHHLHGDRGARPDLPDDGSPSASSSSTCRCRIPEQRHGFETAFTVSIEAAEGVTTGISAEDRAHTMRVAADPACTPGDLDRPGHVFPLRAKQHGVLERTGQTEGSVDLAKLAGLQPAS